MCGIITVVGSDKNNTKNVNISEMLFSLSKRGPDEKDYLNIGNTIMGQTRLSIVDIEGGHQPMKDNSKPLTIVFNGEIYDYKELTKTLREKGHIFSTNSDTEVILKAYIEYGTDCPKHLDGMFAFAIWDEEKKELFVARDRFGKKPFYYTWTNDMFLGSSEIKALFASGLIKGKIDPQAVDNYLQLSYIPPWKTVYSNIHTLLPAHAGIVKNGEFKTWQYWHLKNKQSEISYENAKKEIKELLNIAVKRRMVADVEIGSLLSGGVDSTIITAYAQKYTKQRIKTFSVGYEEHINELPFAKQASEKIGTEHYTLQTKSGLIEKLENVMEYLDEPHADSSNLSQYLISELASSRVKVVMSGDGADELFIGYGWYWKYWNTNKLIRLKNFFFSNQFREYLKHISIFTKKDRLKLWLDIDHLNSDVEKRYTEKRGLSRTRQINIFDLTTYLPGQLLVKIDRMSMVHGLEVRSPFLDYKLAEFVYNLPEKYKRDKNGGKIILKDILSETMPKEFVYRRKQGFGAPIEKWLQTEDVKNFIKKTLDESTQLYKFFQKKEVTNIFDTFYEKNDNKNQYKLWSIFCLALWFKHHQKYHE